jgi:hypothetical protein
VSGWLLLVAVCTGRPGRSGERLTGTERHKDTAHTPTVSLSALFLSSSSVLCFASPLPFLPSVCCFCSAVCTVAWPSQRRHRAEQQQTEKGAEDTTTGHANRTEGWAQRAARRRTLRCQDHASRCSLPRSAASFRWPECCRPVSSAPPVVGSFVALVWFVLCADTPLLSRHVPPVVQAVPPGPRRFGVVVLGGPSRCRRRPAPSDEPRLAPPRERAQAERSAEATQTHPLQRAMHVRELRLVAFLGVNWGKLDSLAAPCLLAVARWLAWRSDPRSLFFF